MVETKITVPSVSQDALTNLAKEAIERGNEAIQRADAQGDSKPIKVFGLFEVDPAIVAYLQAGYNVISNFVEKYLEKHSYAVGGWVASRLGAKSPGAIKAAGAVTTFGVGAAVKSWLYFTPFFQAHADYKQENAKLARKLSPILDDMKGGHSAAALLSVGIDQNEAIYAHRQRFLRMTHAKNSNNFIDLFINAGPNIAFSFINASTMLQKGLSPDELLEFRSSKGAQQNDFRNMAETLANATTAGLSSHLKRGNDKKLEKSTQQNTALELILALEEQVAQNPNASSFRTPGKNSDSFPLEQYVENILIQHQKDMADISPAHTELRSALKEDLEAIAKPIAEALKKGDLAAMTLVRWVGEGKLIKEKGRKLATAAEVQSLLGHAEKAAQPSIVVDPKEYYTDASFTKEDLKTALKSLEGQERTYFAAMFPDAVLGQAGMKDNEIKDVRAATLKSYEHALAEVLSGIAGKSDAELEKDGLAKNEIKQLREAVDALGSKGEGAIRELKTTHAKANGIERALTNWAVSKVKGDKTHFGTVLSNGRAQLPGVLAKASEESADKANNENKAADAPEAADTHVAAVQQSTGEMAAEPAR